MRELESEKERERERSKEQESKGVREAKCVGLRKLGVGLCTKYSQPCAVSVHLSHCPGSGVIKSNLVCPYLEVKLAVQGEDKVRLFEGDQREPILSAQVGLSEPVLRRQVSCPVGAQKIFIG